MLFHRCAFAFFMGAFSGDVGALGCSTPPPFPLSPPPTHPFAPSLQVFGAFPTLRSRCAFALLVVVVSALLAVPSSTHPVTPLHHTPHSTQTPPLPLGVRRFSDSALALRFRAASGGGVSDRCALSAQRAGGDALRWSKVAPNISEGAAPSPTPAHLPLWAAAVHSEAQP